MGLSKKEERNYAQILFVEQKLTLKEIAARVGVSEKTIGRWCKDDGWEKLRNSLLVTKQNQITQLYDQLAWINEDIAKREIKCAGIKEADVIAKITTSIKRLEVETSLGEIIEVAKNLCEFMRGVDLDKAKVIADAFDLFIQTKMK